MPVFDAYGDQVFPYDVLSSWEYAEWLVQTGQITVDPEWQCECDNCPDCCPDWEEEC